MAALRTHTQLLHPVAHSSDIRFALQERTLTLKDAAYMKSGTGMLCLPSSRRKRTCLRVKAASLAWSPQTWSMALTHFQLRKDKQMVRAFLRDAILDTAKAELAGCMRMS